MTDELRGTLLGLLPRLRRFAWALTGSVTTGDALVQAACEHALGHHDERPSGARFDGWLYRIMRDLWIASTPPHTAAESDPDPSRRTPVENPSMLDAVRQDLATLPEDERTLLLLVCADGFTYREAADALGLPIATVVSRLARARLALLADASPPDRARGS
jgi:RNA polymerase sigma-70 factor (ECF subfamily)